MSALVAGDLYPPRDIDPDAAEAARRLFAQECRFVYAAAAPGALPADTLPEIAFAGRSNVGKSSLINALTGRSRLARTSNTPGRTRQLNFFDLGHRLILVDLPGYGFADASKTAISAWTDLVRRYLQRRAALRRLCLLIDARHGIKPVDQPLMDLLDACGLSFQLVFTKADQPKPAELALTAARALAELGSHPAAYPEIHLTSARDGRGIAALRTTLAGFAAAGVASPPRPN
jgi:GTP-binding protein